MKNNKYMIIPLAVMLTTAPTFASADLSTLGKDSELFAMKYNGKDEMRGKGFNEKENEKEDRDEYEDENEVEDEQEEKDEDENKLEDDELEDEMEDEDELEDKEDDEEKDDLGDKDEEEKKDNKGKGEEKKALKNEMKDQLKSLKEKKETQLKSVENTYKTGKQELDKLKDELSAEEFETRKKALKAEYESNKDRVENDLKAEKSAMKDQIIQDRKTVIESLKADKQALKTYADQLRQDIELMENELEAKEELLESVADFYAEAGEIEEAINAQTAAVKEDMKNIERYKKLAKLMESNGDKGIKAFVNGDQPNFDVAPVIKEGRTLVPFRAISEALTADVKWSAEEQAVYVTKDGVELKLVIGVQTAYVNGQEVNLDVPAEILNSRTVVPLRFISEAFGANVNWESETSSVIIVEDNEEVEENIEEEMIVE